MKIFIFFLFTFFSSVSALSQYTWIQKNDFTGGARGNAISVAINDTGYIGMGISNPITYQDWWQYNAALDVWTQKSDFIGGKRSTGVAISANGKAYVGTGNNFDTGQYENDWYQYDPITNVWTQKTSMPTTGRVAATGFSIGNYCYVGTGEADLMTNYFRNDFWRYNTDSDTWLQLSNFPGSPRSYATGLSIDGSGYLAFGEETSITNCSNELWKFDTLNNSWTQLNNIPGFPRGAAIGWAYNGNLFFAAGYYNLFSKFLNDFWQYDINTSSWIPLDTIPISFGLNRVAGFFSSGGFYLATGASSGSASPTPNVWVALPDSIVQVKVLALSNTASIFPNPTSSIVNIQFNSGLNLDGKIEINILDIHGKFVASFSSCMNTGFTCDFSAIENGVYLIEIFNKNYFYRKKIIVSK